MKTDDLFMAEINCLKKDKANLLAEKERLEREVEKKKEEIERLISTNVDLAEKGIFHGNSIQHIWNKKEAYSHAIGETFDAIGGADGKHSLAELAGMIKLERDQLRERVKELQAEIGRLKAETNWGEA